MYATLAVRSYPIHKGLRLSRFKGTDQTFKGGVSKEKCLSSQQEMMLIKCCV